MNLKLMRLKAYERMLHDAHLAAHCRVPADFQIDKHGSGYVLTLDNLRGHQAWLNKIFLEYIPSANIWRTSLEGDEIFTLGCPISELIAEIKGYLPYQVISDAICIDAGTGSSGLFGLCCSKLAPKGHFYFIEADPRPLKNCAHNIRINQLKNYFILPFALTSESRQLAFSIYQEVGASRISDSGDLLLKVQGITIEQVLMLAGAKPDNHVYFKMDIEGGETDLIDGVSESILKYPRIIYSIASYHMVGDEPAWKILHRGLKRYDYISGGTFFPRHTTTILCHKDNEMALHDLQGIEYMERLS